MAVMARLLDGVLETIENRTLFALLTNFLPSCAVELARESSIGCERLLHSVPLLANLL